MYLKLVKTKRYVMLSAVLYLAYGCAYQAPTMKLQRASFNRCVYQVEQRNVCWDVRAFVDDGNHSKGEEFIISLNLVVEDYQNIGTFKRMFKVKKVKVYFGTDLFYQGKRFDHDDWIGPTMGSSNNMLRLDKERIGDGNLSVVVWTEDDLGRLYKCESGHVKIGSI